MMMMMMMMMMVMFQSGLVIDVIMNNLVTDITN